MKHQNLFKRGRQWLLTTCLALGALTGQAQITIDGRITAAEKGSAPGQYQSIGRFTGQHGFGDWGMVEAFAGYDANFVYLAIQGALEPNGNAFQFWYNVPARRGIAAGNSVPVALSPSGEQTSFDGEPSGNPPADDLGKFDFEVDQALAVRYDPPGSGNLVLEVADFSNTPASSLVAGNMDDLGTSTTFLAGAIQAAFRRSLINIVTNTDEGVEIRFARAALGLVNNQVIQLFALMTNRNGGYASSDFIPEGPVPLSNPAGPNMGPEPDFTTVQNNQYLDFRLGTCTLAAPNVVTSGPICAGQSLGLTATGVPLGSTYLWTGPNGFSSTQPAPLIPNVTAAAAGSYTLRTTDPTTGCTATSVPTQVIVNVPPAPVIQSQIPSGGAVELRTSGGGTYQWYLNGQLIPNATDSTYLAQQSGGYAVVVTAPNGCSATSATVNIIVTSVARELAGADLTLFPNPAPDGRVMLHLTGFHEAVALTLLDGTGRTVRSECVAEPTATGPTTALLELTDLPAGVYTLRAATTRGTLVRRLVR